MSGQNKRCEDEDEIRILLSIFHEVFIQNQHIDYGNQHKEETTQAVLVVDTMNSIFNTKFKGLELNITYDSKVFGTKIDEVQLLYQNTR